VLTDVVTEPLANNDAENTVVLLTGSGDPGPALSASPRTTSTRPPEGRPVAVIRSDRCSALETVTEPIGADPSTVKSSCPRKRAGSPK
jgi:hypothetical protein